MEQETKYKHQKVALTVRFTDKAFLAEAARLGITEDELRVAMARLILPGDIPAR